MTSIGYAWVSAPDQDTAPQIDALKRVGYGRIFEDHASSARADRPGLVEALGYLREGDVLVVWKPDRIGRSLPHLIETATTLKPKDVGFR